MGGDGLERPAVRRAWVKALKPDLHVGVTVGAGRVHQHEVPAQVNAMIERFVQVAVAAQGHPGD
jgi:hypothetical protein